MSIMDEKGTMREIIMEKTPVADQTTFLVSCNSAALMMDGILNVFDSV